MSKKFLFKDISILRCFDFVTILTTQLCDMNDNLCSVIDPAVVRLRGVTDIAEFYMRPPGQKCFYVMTWFLLKSFKIKQKYLGKQS